MKAGDLVRIKHDSRYDDSGAVGVIRWASPTTNVHLYRNCGIYLFNTGTIEVYRQKHVELISERR